MPVLWVVCIYSLGYAHTLPEAAPQPLSQLERAALVALAEATGLSSNAHVPVQAVLSKVPKHLRGDLKKALDRLRRRQFCAQHPTRGGITWQLSSEGVRMAKEVMSDSTTGS